MTERTKCTIRHHASYATAHTSAKADQFIEFARSNGAKWNRDSQSWIFQDIDIDKLESAASDAFDYISSRKFTRKEIAAMQAKVAAKQTRRDDTRIKIIVGSLMISESMRDEKLLGQLLELLRCYARKSDIPLFCDGVAPGHIRDVLINQDLSEWGVMR